MTVARGDPSFTLLLFSATIELDLVTTNLSPPTRKRLRHTRSHTADPMVDITRLKARTRADYPYMLEYRTRW